MTPAELRALVEEATPGPWEADPEHDVISVEMADVVANTFTEADARLIALVPKLALLCAEMGEALREMKGSAFFTLKSEAALSSLEALKKPQ